VEKLAPQIFRQRLLIEGFYLGDVDRARILSFFDQITEALNVTGYTEPFVSPSEGHGQLENQGFEAFLPLIESGIALYTWNQARFLSLIIYTCKPFSNELALETTVRFFELDPYTSDAF
jgi:S-adenosylmethionine/arginine decarboxylase-like enzyme